MAEQTKNGNTLTPEELASPFEWNVADPDLMGNNIVVDLSKSASFVYRIPTKATQGDNGRELTFALRDGTNKHPITPTTQVFIEAIDSDTKFKYGVGTHDAIKDGKGLVTVPLDQEFFEAHGYLYAQLVVMDPPTLVSTVPLRMEVANNPFITAVTNADFASPIKDKLDAVTKMITETMDSWKLTESTLNESYANVLKKLDDLLAKIAAGDFAKLSADNTYMGKQTFSAGAEVTGGFVADSLRLSNGDQPLYPKDFNPLKVSDFQNFPVQMKDGWSASIVPVYYFYMTNPGTQEGILRLEANLTHSKDIPAYNTVDMFEIMPSFPFSLEDNWELAQGVTNVDAFGVPYWIKYNGARTMQIHTLNAQQNAANPVQVSVMIHAKYTGGN